VNTIETINPLTDWSWIKIPPMAYPEHSQAGRKAEPTELDPDMQSMLEVARGNDAALAGLIEKWQKPLINYFYRSLNSREQAADLTQILFINLYRAAPRYQPTAKFSTYLFSIARRLLINEYRKNQRNPMDLVDPATLSNWTHTARANLNTMEIEEAFQEALKTLPDNHRDALLLYKQQELSYQEIAEIMNATESSVKTWIFRARQKLKAILKDQLQP